MVLSQDRMHLLPSSFPYGLRIKTRPLQFYLFSYHHDFCQAFKTTTVACLLVHKIFPNFSLFQEIHIARRMQTALSSRLDGCLIVKCDHSIHFESFIFGSIHGSKFLHVPVLSDVLTENHCRVP